MGGAQSGRHDTGARRWMGSVMWCEERDEYDNALEEGALIQRGHHLKLIMRHRNEDDDDNAIVANRQECQRVDS